MSDLTLAQCMARGRQMLEPVDVTAILGHVLGSTKEYLISHPELILTHEQYARFESLIIQREEEYPLAYILGHKEFWSLDFIVTPDVLIPRPDTETLVELALQHCPPSAEVLELATGSGAIACALAHERADITVLATDISSSALGVAAQNVKHHGLAHISLLCSDWFDAIPAQKFDLIVANPPYLADDDHHLLNEIRYEPRSALVAPEHGLGDIQVIAREARRYMKPGGIFMLEHGYEQGAAVSALLHECGYEDVRVIKDLSGHDRVTMGAIRPHVGAD